MDWARIAFTLRYGERRGRCLAICLSVVCVFCIASQADAATTNNNETKDASGWASAGFPSGADCSGADPSKNISVSCYGIRIVRRIVQQFLERSSQEPNLEILDGVSLVEVPANAASSPFRKGKFMKGFGGVGSLMQFLEGRELRIKLPALLPQNLETALQESLPVDQGSHPDDSIPSKSVFGSSSLILPSFFVSVSARRGNGGGFGGGGGGGGFRGGKKGGGGGMMMLALMMGKTIFRNQHFFLLPLRLKNISLSLSLSTRDIINLPGLFLRFSGKMMAALGFGALGLLAMKALMVSALALMLSLIVAVKKLASGHESGGGHHVVYAQDVGHHHYRKKRSSSIGEEDLPYRGYAHLFADSRVS